jgi:dimethylargininase
MNRLLALTRAPSPKLADCQLTFVARSSIDYPRAVRQHAEYCNVLRGIGAEVHTLAASDELADCVFVEDTAIVLDEAAFICRPGPESRRAETAAVEAELRQYRPIERAVAPATIEGGDVLVVGRTLLVGKSSRTSAAGIEALTQFAGRFGYAVRAVPVHGCLHLKTACTALPDGSLFVNRDWIDTTVLGDFRQIAVPKAEPWGANLICAAGSVVVAAEHQVTAALAQSLGFDVRTVAIDEFAKAEGGVTCLSLLFSVHEE